MTSGALASQLAVITGFLIPASEDTAVAGEAGVVGSGPVINVTGDTTIPDELRGVDGHEGPGRDDGVLPRRCDRGADHAPPGAGPPDE